MSVIRAVFPLPVGPTIEIVSPAVKVRLKNNAAGGGTYKVESWKPGQEIVYARFDNWKSGPMPKVRRVIQRDLAHPSRAEWVETIRREIVNSEKPAVLVAHSLGVIAALHAAQQLRERIAGACMISEGRSKKRSYSGIGRSGHAAPKEPWARRRPSSNSSRVTTRRCGNWTGGSRPNWDLTRSLR